MHHLQSAIDVHNVMASALTPLTVRPPESGTALRVAFLVDYRFRRRTFADAW
jgi:hypothetical protein